MQNNLINLYANCIAVKGAKRSVICDLQRSHFIFIPNVLADLFIDDSTLNKIEFSNRLDEEDKLIFNEYLTLLESHDMIFYCSKSELKYFPKLSTVWDFPSLATNMIIDVNSESNLDFANIIQRQLNEVNCRFIQVRAFSDIHLNQWQILSNLVEKSEVKSIEIIAKDNIAMRGFFESLITTNRKIKTLILHSSSKYIDEGSDERRHPALFITAEVIINSSHCGIIHHDYFVVNTKTYTESLHHNTCLNRKIAIDVDGNIKNCPSMKESFGNIRDITLAEAINKPGFQKYWNVTKDQITKCKDCEFRHICTDCRAYVDNPDDMYSAPLKCGYDPYTCEWEEWSTHPLKQKAIDYYGMRDIL